MEYKSIVLSTEIPSLEFERGGREFTIPVKVQNGSDVDLFSSQDIYLTYHVLDSNSNVMRWDNERTEIAILPGDEESVSVICTAPNEAGDYYLEIDIVREGVEWYSAQGMNVVIVPIKVLQKGSKYREMLEEEIREQKEIEAGFLEILSTGKYGIESPFIKLNPYGNSPLTAIMLFQTEVPMSVSVKVVGKTEEADIKGDFKGYTKEHLIPVYGLYADYLNTIIVIGETTEGE